MKKFITPALTLLRGVDNWFREDRQNSSWWFCEEILKEYWEIPRVATCWLEVRDEEMRGSYAINLRLDRFGNIEGEFQIDGKEFQFVDTREMILPAKELGVRSIRKTFYVRLITLTGPSLIAGVTRCA